MWITRLVTARATSAGHPWPELDGKRRGHFTASAFLAPAVREREGMDTYRFMADDDLTRHNPGLTPVQTRLIPGGGWWCSCDAGLIFIAEFVQVTAPPRSTPSGPSAFPTSRPPYPNAG